jgi:hypothetical protein
MDASRQAAVRLAVFKAALALTGTVQTSLSESQCQLLVSVLVGEVGSFTSMADLTEVRGVAGWRMQSPDLFEPQLSMRVDNPCQCCLHHPPIGTPRWQRLHWRHSSVIPPIPALH